ncbi:MAG: MerR family transcriptional regulator [Butyrivibrio sp.]|nr:MerR family transcriptional regulator [Butyrivibrio sp.]
MMTVNEVSKLTGVSIRALQYYDKIGLLKPAEHTESGYRLYDDTALERLQQILLFKELEFPLKDIKEIIDSPDFDRNKALAQQIELLTLKKEHLENLISLARVIKLYGGKYMNFAAFDTKKIDEYMKRAKEQWGNTPEYKEYEEKKLTDEEKNGAVAGLIKIFEDFGKIKDKAPDSKEAHKLVERLQAYLDKNFYKCSCEMLLNLGKMYAGGGEFTENINSYGGDGTADFVYEAIKSFCNKK